MRPETFRYRARSHPLREALVDVWRPEGPGPHPAVIVAHGGGFLGGGRRMRAVATLTEALPRAGFLTIAFDYRLFLRGGGLAEAVEDAVAVDRWWRERAHRYGAVHTSIVGLSAGALVVTSAAKRLGPLRRIAGIYGAYDLLALPGRAEPVTRRLLLGTGRRDRARDASPCRTLDLDVPLGLFHGLRDGLVPVDHTLAMARFRRERGLPVETHLYDDVGHGFLRYPETAACRRAVADLVAFLGGSEVHGAPEGWR